MQPYKIILDCMGGDYAPAAPVEGALLAIAEFPGDFVIQLVGQRKRIEDELSRVAKETKLVCDSSRIEIVDAPDVISMQDKLSDVRHTKSQSSIHIGLSLTKSGESEAFVSAGNTGVVIGLSQIKLGRIPGVKRSALTVVFPTANGPCINLDVGANADNVAGHIAQFAVMGSVYAQDVVGIANPRVALMNVGVENSKGNPLVLDAYALLEEFSLRGALKFVGNVEGNDVLMGAADVIAFNGFTGNVVLKLAESLIPALQLALKRKLRSSSKARQLFALIAKILLKPTLASIKRDFDYQEYGGASLLGVRGVVIKAHGQSTPLALMHAINVASKAITHGITSKIQDRIAVLPWTEMQSILDQRNA